MPNRNNPELYQTASSLAGLLTPPLRLRFYDLDVNIYADSAAYLCRLQWMYRRFQVEGPATRPPLEFVVLMRSDNPWGQPALIRNDTVWPLGTVEDGDEYLDEYLYAKILNEIVARVRSHFILHAGAVAHADQGVLLVADSFYGKTTLALELVRRGFRFLSDDIAALSRSDHQIYAFPRALELRQGTLQLTGYSPNLAQTQEWRGKLLVDIDELEPESLGATATLRYILHLQASPAPRRESGQIASILLDRMSQDFLSEVRQLPGVQVLSVERRGSTTLLKIQAPELTGALRQLEELCQAHRLLVLSIGTGTRCQPTFAIPATLRALSLSQALPDLLRHLCAGYHSAVLLDEYKGDAAQLYFELAGLVGCAHYYQLQVGPLEQMADLVCGLVLN